MLFDTHVHLNDPRYSDYKEIINKALKANVKKMVVVGYDLESSKKAIEIANHYDFIYCSIGLHPDRANSDYDNDLKELKTLVNDKVVAIGEIGLDYHYPGYDKDRQQDLFIKQIKIAKEHNLPILIHSRDACNDTYLLLEKYKSDYKKGIMHCYSYSQEYSKKFIALNFYLGIGGVVTYKNAKEIKEVVTNTDLKHLVLETDAPYLAPSPYRGEMNEPQYIGCVSREIARLKNLSEEQVEEATFINACKLFEVDYED